MGCGAECTVASTFGVAGVCSSNQTTCLCPEGFSSHDVFSERALNCDVPDDAVLALKRFALGMDIFSILLTCFRLTELLDESSKRGGVCRFRRRRPEISHPAPVAWLDSYAVKVPFVLLVLVSVAFATVDADVPVEVYIAMNAVFSVETLLRFFFTGAWAYFADGYCCTDIVLVLVDWVAIGVELGEGGEGSVVPLLRILRILRLIRLARRGGGRGNGGGGGGGGAKRFAQVASSTASASSQSSDESSSSGPTTDKEQNSSSKGFKFANAPDARVGRRTMSGRASGITGALRRIKTSKGKTNSHNGRMLALYLNYLATGLFYNVYSIHAVGFGVFHSDRALVCRLALSVAIALMFSGIAQVAAAWFASLPLRMLGGAVVKLKKVLGNLERATLASMLLVLPITWLIPVGLPALNTTCDDAALAGISIILLVLVTILDYVCFKMRKTVRDAISSSPGGDADVLKGVLRVVEGVFVVSLVLGGGAFLLLQLLIWVKFFRSNSWLFFSIVEICAIIWLIFVLLVWAKPKKQKRAPPPS